MFSNGFKTSGCAAVNLHNTGLHRIQLRNLSNSNAYMCSFVVWNACSYMHNW